MELGERAEDEVEAIGWKRDDVAIASEGNLRVEFLLSEDVRMEGIGL